MNLFTTKLQEVKFEERPVIVKDSEDEGWTDYDIFVDDPDDNTQYCIALLNKLQSLRLSVFRESFIDHQCGLVSAPKSWLASLDQLIAENVDFFYELRREHLLLPFYALIANRMANDPGTIAVRNNEDKPALINSPYDIEKTKKYLEGVWDLSDQGKILRRLKIDYQQTKDNFHPAEHLPFDEQVKLEMDHLKLLIRYDRQPVFDNAKGRYIQRLTIVGDLKMLAVAFRKLLEHKGDNNRPYLLIRPDDFILFLISVLQTQEGKPIDREILIQNIFPSQKNSKKTASKYLQTEFLNSIPKERYYTSNIDEVKYSLKSLSDYTSRLIYLSRVLTNFLQRQTPGLDDNSFVRKIKLEVKHQETELQLEKSGLKGTDNRICKIEINGRINVLMTFFYDLIETLPKKHQVVLIRNSKRDIIYFVEKYFVQSGGKKISRHSLRSMLTPSKWDKRCSADKRINFIDCLKV